MERPQTTRPAPRVVCVPPPEGDIASTRVLTIIGIVIIVAATIIVIAVGNTTAMAIVIPIAIGLGVFLVWLPHPINAGFRRRRAEYLATRADAAPDELAAAVGRMWQQPLKPPKPADVLTTLRAADLAQSDRGYVVCLGMFEPPEVEAEFFEPEIITPTRAIGNHLWFIPPAVIVLVFFVLQIMHVIPGKAVNIGSFGYIIMMGVGAAITWVWRSVLRPTYIRMAPGVIQILEYRHHRAKPLIRSYPLEAGTLVFIQGPISSLKPAQLILTLVHGEQQDKLELWKMRKRDEIIKRTWEALLSTAPTPPLSDEDLVG